MVAVIAGNSSSIFGIYHHLYTMLYINSWGYTLEHYNSAYHDPLQIVKVVKKQLHGMNNRLR